MINKIMRSRGIASTICPNFIADALFFMKPNQWFIKSKLKAVNATDPLHKKITSIIDRLSVPYNDIFKIISKDNVLDNYSLEVFVGPCSMLSFLSTNRLQVALNENDQSENSIAESVSKIMAKRILAFRNRLFERICVVSVIETATLVLLVESARAFNGEDYVKACGSAMACLICVILRTYLEADVNRNFMNSSLVDELSNLFLVQAGFKSKDLIKENENI